MIQTYRNGNKKIHQTAYPANKKETQLRPFNNFEAALKRYDWCHNSIIKTIMNNVIMSMSEDFKIYADINSFEKLKKKEKLYGPFLWMGFNCLKASVTSRRQVTFCH